MKTISKLALLAALSLVPSAALSQTSLTLDSGADISISSETSGGTSTGTGGADASGSSSTSVSFDVDADGSLSADELSDLQASLEAVGRGDLVIDVNGDGRISVDEAAEVTAALSGNVDVDVDIDADADGSISDDELAAAVSSGDVACGDAGLAAMIAALGEVDQASISAATDVRVVLVSDCAEADVSAALATEGATNVRQMLDANAAAISAIRARGATMADVLGVGASGDMLVVFVASDDTASS